LKCGKPNFFRILTCPPKGYEIDGMGSILDRGKRQVFIVFGVKAAGM
jgi:hypothetical protein